MLTLVTGIPGAGKTLNTIQTVHEKWGDSGRKIYYRGINELALDWEEIDEEQCRKWYDLPDNSVVVIDEAQDVFPQRPHTKEPPEYVKRMAKHRHRGFDFYLLTQKQTHVDHDLRSYANEHLHYERPTGHQACKEYRWPKAVDPQDRMERSKAETKIIRYNKEYFDLYKSAEVHTIKAKIPPKVIAVIALCVVVLGLAVNFVFNMTEKFDEPDQVADQVPDQVEQYFDINQFQDIPETPSMSYAEKWMPRIRDLPYSAPVYDELTQVKQFPMPQCMYDIKRDKCRCYTQQATPLDISHDACIDMVHNGWFNPFKDDEEASRPGREPASRGLEATSETPTPI